MFFSQPEGVLDTDTHRTCSECGESKILDDFYKDGRRPDGTLRYRRDCKECYVIRRNRAKALKKEQEYRQRKRSRNSISLTALNQGCLTKVAGR